MMSFSTINVKPISGYVGAEIDGINLKKMSKDQFEEIKIAFGEYGVIFFRDQNLSPQEEINFAEHWGKININRFFSNLEGYPKIALVAKEPNQKKNIGGAWHTDHTYDLEPAMGSILFAHQVPKNGGDTMFSSMYAAYESLSEGLKDTLKNLYGRHSSRHVFGKSRAERNDDTVGRIINSDSKIFFFSFDTKLSTPISSSALFKLNIFPQP